ncbi:MAG: dCTP deaminase [Salinirussus sp.]
MALVDRLEGIVHEPTQSEGDGFDLTLAAVYEVSEPGRVDFGGGELEHAELQQHDTELRDADDEYEWYNLQAGQYLLEHNESLIDNGPAITVQPRRALLERGASHPTISANSLPRLPLAVGGAGIKLKENARISTLKIPD